MTHAVIRTSPFGQPFKGRCHKCGEEGLGMGGALQDCPADGLVSDRQALLDILDADHLTAATDTENNGDRP